MKSTYIEGAIIGSFFTTIAYTVFYFQGFSSLTIELMFYIVFITGFTSFVLGNHDFETSLDRISLVIEKEEDKAKSIIKDKEYIVKD